jgi:hypothetical protein
VERTTNAQVRSATARAKTHCSLFKITKGKFDHILSKCGAPARAGPHPRRDLAHRSRILELGSPYPNLHPDWARPCHIGTRLAPGCIDTWTGLTTLPHLYWGLG